MLTSKFPPNPKNFKSWADWAEQLVNFMKAPAELKRAVQPEIVSLSHLLTPTNNNLGQAKAEQDGLMMFGVAFDAPVFSSSGAWVPLARKSQVDTLTTNTNKSPRIVAGQPLETNTAIDFGLGAITASDVSIVFSAPFAATPFIVATPVGALGATGFQVVAISAKSATGFTASLRAQASGTTSKPVSGSFNWIAIGQRA